MATVLLRFLSITCRSGCKSLQRSGFSSVTKRMFAVRSIFVSKTVDTALVQVWTVQKRNFSANGNGDDSNCLSTSERGGDTRSDLKTLCPGCGAWLQSDDPLQTGYILPHKLEGNSLSGTPTRSNTNWKEVVSVEDEGVQDTKEQTGDRSSLICQRCFNLKHYNRAVGACVPEENYLQHLEHLRNKRALILLVIDVLDFPASLFPDLHLLIPPSTPIIIVANKTDLLPVRGAQSVLGKLRDYILRTSKETSLCGCFVKDVHFVCAKTGENVDSLSEEVIRFWGNRGDVYLLGCTNVGKSSLFTKLLVTLCGLEPGFQKNRMGTEVLSPCPTVSPLPSTTLGVLSYPIMSMGKRRRLTVRQLRNKHHVDESNTDSFDPRNLYYNADVEVKTKQRIYRDEFSPTEEVLTEIGLRSEDDVAGNEPSKGLSLPLNRHWLHDTPGAVNSEQIITHLTPKELKVVLATKPLKPRTFILKPGESILLGGLSQLDYLDGQHAAYFTVFASSLLPIHPTKTSNVDRIHRNHAGGDLLKVCVCVYVQVWVWVGCCCVSWCG